MYLCVYVSMCIRVYVSMYLCVYVSMCLCIYVSTCLEAETRAAMQKRSTSQFTRQKWKYTFTFVTVSQDYRTTGEVVYTTKAQSDYNSN